MNKKPKPDKPEPSKVSPAGEKPLSHEQGGDASPLVDPPADASSRFIEICAISVNS